MSAAHYPVFPPDRLVNHLINALPVLELNSQKEERDLRAPAGSGKAAPSRGSRLPGVSQNRNRKENFRNGRLSTIRRKTENFRDRNCLP